MSVWMNFHSHTHYCDGANPIQDYVTQALQLGLPAYGFSSHAPVSFPTNWCIPNDRFNDYLSDVKKLKEMYHDKIQLYLGLEIDYIPGVAGRKRHILKDQELDYFISSVHFVDSFEDGTHWNIDTSFELFRQGLLNIFNNDFRKAATRFYEISREMILEEKPDVIGHIDKIKMFNSKGNFFSEEEKWYCDQIDVTIDCLKQSNSIIEINTRGYYRYGVPDLYPATWIVKKLNKAGIPLMINSDAHKPEEITEGMSFAAHELKSAGVQKLHALLDGKWQEFDFSEQGLLI